MGTIDEVATLFSNQQDRPNFLAAITKHGVYSTGPFKSVHAGLANVTIGQVSLGASATSKQAQYLVDRIVEAKILAATEVAPQELLYLQLEKLAINSIVNPLTALFRVKNGELLEHDEITGLSEVLLAETSAVLQSLPEAKDGRIKFTKQELMDKFVDSATKTAGNTSSMLQDIKASRETEIDYINGWIVNRGKEQGTKVDNNEKVVGLIKQRSSLTVGEVDRHFDQGSR